jgi:hypothetical protein
MAKYLKLIVEDDFYDYKTIITESKETGAKKVRLVGPFIVADKENNNKRKYIYEELKPEVDAFINNFVSKGRATGELEHPAYAKICPERAAHKIEKLELDEANKIWIGTSVVMATDLEHGIKGTPQGDILVSHIQYGVPTGFSTRGVGVIEDGVVKNYKISTVDCVTNPSIGIFSEGILESKDFMIDTHGVIVECAYNELEKSLARLPQKDRSEHIERALKRFISEI